MILKNWFLIVRGEDKYGNIKSFVVKSTKAPHEFKEGDKLLLEDKNGKEIEVELGEEVTQTY